ncbi:RNA polymerase sigma factor [Candidatus Nomurabacteria bacterium]|nr:RNA polymerase sigma factor [Candidatus Nomurabacteria bacterium]
MLGLTTTERAQDLSDEEVLLRARREPWLFAILLERHQDAFLRKARSIIHNEEDAEEIVQDTFTKVYMNADRFEVRDGATFTSWAYRILMNTAFTRYQKRRKEGERFSALDPEFEQFIGEQKNHSGFEGQRDAIERILERLPGHFAQVLRLHYLERWSHQDIADESGESVGAVKTRIHRAKEAFRQEADGEESTLLS